MPKPSFEKLFPSDRLSKRERVERTLANLPVDRVPLHDQVSFNPDVVALYTGKDTRGFNYTREDVCVVIQKTLDACFPPRAPYGTARVVDSDGYVQKNDNWTVWTVSRPFHDLAGAREFIKRKADRLAAASFNAEQAREHFHNEMIELQGLIGDTVIIPYPANTGLCPAWSCLGIELFTYLYADEPELVSNYIELLTVDTIRRIHAIADTRLTPVVLVADDFATKQGPIFSPAFLRKEHFPRLERVTKAWHEHGLKVIYHSDGNWRQVIPDLVATGLDGFYCLEPSIGMEIVGLRRDWPTLTWMGGVDGVDLMERGNPEQVRAEVHRIIRDSDALHKGGIFIDTSSEINPPIKVENYKMMIEATGELTNPDLL